MFHNLFRTSDDRTLALVRVTLGVMMFAHGAQKLLGWFGGYGFEGTMGFFTGTLGVPAFVAAVVIVGEFLAGLGLIGGLLARVSAAGTIAILLGAIAMVHLPFGFFMNWSGQQGGEGFELHLLAIAMSVHVLVRGAGAYSLDQRIARRLEASAAEASHRLRRLETATR